MTTDKMEEVQCARDAELQEVLVDVWEESVRKSHFFLNEQDIVHIRPYVVMAIKEVEHLIVMSRNEIIKGFMGIHGDKIEMLFLAPDCIGQGYGSRLVDLAVGTYGVKRVDVNEQNAKAALFYERKGFYVIGRDAFDEQGNPFPILHMSRSYSIDIFSVKKEKKQYLDLLLLGDEQESMIDRYLDRGEMFVMYISDSKILVGVAVVTNESDGVCELKNIAISPAYQGKGFGKSFIEYLCGYYEHRFSTMIVGTGNSIKTTSFYLHCGFEYSHVLKNFFTENYDHPIVEDGEVLKDMVYFSRHLG